MESARPVTEVEDGKQERSCATAGCHDNKSEDVPLAKDSFHKLCRDGCHKETRAAQPENERLQKVKACKACHAI